MSRADWRAASGLFSVAVFVFVLWVAWMAPQPTQQHVRPADPKPITLCQHGGARCFDLTNRSR